MTQMRLRRNATALADIIDRVRLPAFCLFLALIFITGGGSRGDITSLLFLRPVAALVLVGTLIGISRDQLRDIRWPLTFVGGLAAITALQLLPMPPAIWTALPGRDYMVDALNAAGLPVGWHAISLSPTRSWNALYSLMVPAAALTAYARLDSDERRATLPVSLVIGLASALLGLLQLIGPRRSALYFYEITNNGSAVGLFANRNHQAVLLASLFPMLAAWLLTNRGSKQSQNLRQWAALGAAVAVVPMLMATGSRAGIVFGVLGMASIFAFLPSARYPAFEVAGKTVTPKWLVAALALLALPVLFLFASRIDAVERFAGVGMDDELRVSLWDPVSKMISGNLPFGGGMGTFSDIYKRVEPDALLNWSYVNHAHNDLIEFVYEGGLLSLGLLALAVWVLIRAALAVWRDRASVKADAVMARAALVAIAMLLGSSLVDYPLRVPSMATYGVLLMAWLTAPLAKAQAAS